MRPRWAKSTEEAGEDCLTAVAQAFSSCGLLGCPQHRRGWAPSAPRVQCMTFIFLSFFTRVLKPSAWVTQDDTIWNREKEQKVEGADFLFSFHLLSCYLCRQRSKFAKTVRNTVFELQQWYHSCQKSHYVPTRLTCWMVMSCRKVDEGEKLPNSSSMIRAISTPYKSNYSLI